MDKKTRSGISINEQLAQELHKPVIEKQKKKSMWDLKTIFTADLAEMESLSSKNKNVKYL